MSPSTPLSHRDATCSSTQIDSQIDLTGVHLELKDIISSFPADYFSVRWAGEISVTSSGTYTIYASTDSKVHVYVDGVEIINEWPGTSEECLEMFPHLGTHHSIVVEYSETTEDAFISLHGVALQPVW